MNTQPLNQTNFDSTIASSSTPVLVDFWAEWCGPCKMIAPVLEELAVEVHGKAIIAKVNIDESPELAARFGITAIPTLVVFKSGKAVQTLKGVQSRRTLTATIAAAA